MTLDTIEDVCVDGDGVLVAYASGRLIRHDPETAACLARVYETHGRVLAFRGGGMAGWGVRLRAAAKLAANADGTGVARGD